MIKLLEKFMNNKIKTIDIIYKWDIMINFNMI